MSKKEKLTENAQTRQIEVHFDVSRIQDPISIVPDRIELSPQDTGIEFVLKTVGSSGRQATFPMSEFISWVEGAAADAGEAIFNEEKTRARLPLRARNGGAEELRFPYHLSAEYKGTVYTSGGYPVVCDPPPDTP